MKSDMTPAAIADLIEIQVDLAELRDIACTLDPETEKALLMFVDQMEAYARDIDQMS